ncbi:MAG: DUF1616 domain-containing protein [Caldilineaceae bacterium]|nr:DUF1616 domain-containing protein [Caldilineaceae bacterium]
MNTAIPNLLDTQNKQRGHSAAQPVAGFSAPGRDLLLIGVGALLLAETVWAPWRPAGLAPLRLILGLVYLFYAPGYCLLAALFPRSDEFSSAGRNALSIGLSIVLVVLISLIFDRSQITLHTDSMLLALLTATFGCGLAAYGQRALLPKSDKGKWQPGRHFRHGWQIMPAHQKRIYALIGSAAMVAMFSIFWLLQTPVTAVHSTEYYLLGPDDTAENYPRTVAAGEEISTTLGIVNQEEMRHTFRVEIYAPDAAGEAQVLFVGTPFLLQPNESRESPITWQVPQLNRGHFGAEQPVDFLLFMIDGQSPNEPYRQLRLWLKVSQYKH